MKPYFIVASLIVAFVLILPAAIVFPFSGEQQAAPPTAVPASSTTGQETKTSLPEQPPLTVSVYRSQEQQIDSLSMEQYITGVVASEMPAKFEPEALKAQALAARTYIVHFVLESPDMNLPKGADVCDTVNCQVYKSASELKERWGTDYNWKMAKISKAVQATKGEIITYNDKPIQAQFFSSSNGYTENSEDYWPNAVPYLKSVASPWDRTAPKFTSQKAMPVQAFDNKLGVDIAKNGPIGDIVKTTAGKRVGVVKIDGKKFTGREVRESLDLNSSDFSMKRKGDQVIITTKGWGHGVGMSQYGANGMAKEGKSYKDIIKHYYQGVSISNVGPYTAKLTSKE